MDVDDLYCLPLDRFVPERDVLAKRLRTAGRREEAAAVAKLVKPSIAAWAVNQVVRAQARQAEALWDAGDEVLATQSRVVEGEASAADLRGAIARERAALESLADAARGLLTARETFLTEQNVQSVIETLHAAAIDPAAREEVAAGRAVRPLQLAGLEAVPAARPARAGGKAVEEPAAGGGSKGRATRSGAKGAGTESGERAAGRGGRGSKADPAGTAAERARLAERTRRDAETEKARRAAQAERAARRREAQRALARAERDRDAARARVQAAVKARDAAGAKVEAAEAELARAEGARADAHAALERAEDTVDAARGALDEVS